jgi:hypothetical protein
MGFMYNDFEDHRQLGTSATHSSLMKDWIRVVLFVKPLTSKVL